jgi:hypothetical protein
MIILRIFQVLFWEKKSFIDLTSDSTVKTAFKTKNISNFWLEVKQEYTALSTQALQFIILNAVVLNRSDMVAV